ncbi:cobalt-precorrin-6A reductase [Alkaliphilus pronyensis]|uniref:Cobalt-precorrin-6A reductase n=1 Tax=Alkaliphilus pronyensis TaxID=1482732 RepID=A0A6I0FJX2_9FIRM|nr:cobalt-precorrin-6A reductase [Alkaliphilus pronyensis]KAB3539059.1 cobalt-precorrin-6A reductase [Alkaliphilus pronyensis]
MILILSGTKDSRLIIKSLLAKGYKLVATTATDYGGELIEKHQNLEIISTKLNQSQMENLINEKTISLIVDTTHPYAQEVTENAINASKNLSIPYIRYERKQTINSVGTRYSSYKEAAGALENCSGNILLTIGSNHLEDFSYLNKANNLYARVLPTPYAINKCVDMGLHPKQIIAMQGPFSQKLNEEIYRHYSIKYLVTKDSGAIGGMKEKLEAALRCNIKVIIIDRPKTNYGNISYEIDDLVKKIEDLLM